MLDGIKNFLTFINDNWTSLIIIVSLLFTLYKRIQVFLKKSNQEKIDIAKTQISEIIMKLITDAEFDYGLWNKTGSIKRSQVIKKIYDDYPILQKVANQDDLTAWIDSLIDDSLKELNEIFNTKELE